MYVTHCGVTANYNQKITKLIIDFYKETIKILWSNTWILLICLISAAKKKKILTRLKVSIIMLQFICSITFVVIICNY